MSVEMPTLDKAPTVETYGDILEKMSVEHMKAIDQAVNRAGLPDDLPNLIDVYIEFSADEKEAKENVAAVLRALKSRPPGSQDFQTKLTEFIKLIK